MFRGVWFSYASGAAGAAATPALRDVTLTVHEGERLGVLGPNGGGKSTLLKLALGLLKPTKGEVRVFGMSPVKARGARLIGYVPQKTTAELAFPLSARRVVEMTAGLGNAPWRGLSNEQKAAVQEAIRVVGAEEIAERPIGALSGGQLQRVMIARALASKPRILLLDEPTVGIDAAGQQQFAELLSRLHRELKLTIVVVSHDIRTVAAGCDRVACLSRTLHCHVAPGGLTPAVLAEVFRHDVAAIFGDLHVDAHAAAACKDPSHAHAGGGPAKSGQGGGGCCGEGRGG